VRTLVAIGIAIGAELVGLGADPSDPWGGHERTMRRQDLALIGLLALVFAPALLALARVWSSVDYYSHGFLVPLVAYWIFRSQIRGLAAADRDARGTLLLAVSFLVYAAGLFQASVSLQGVGVVIAVAGTVLRTWGTLGLRRLAFPVAFLLFMVPIPPSLLSPVIVWLQLQVSVASVAILHALGFTVLRAGNVVLLPGGESLFVAEACSGITSLVTLLPLGIVLAYFSPLSRIQRLLLVAAVVPVAMFGNLVRVIATVFAARHYGVAHATSSTLHEFAGLLSFLLECALLIALIPLLRWFSGACCARRGVTRAA